MNTVGVTGVRRSTAPLPEQFSSGSVALQRVGILAGMPALVAELGFDPDEMARQAGVCPITLRDPDSVITLSRFAAVYEVAADVTRCSHIGLLLGSRSTLGMLGLMGEYMANAPTLGVAMTDIASHQHRYARGTRPYLVVSRDDVVLGYRVHEAGVPAVEQMSDAAVAFGNVIFREFCGEPPIEVMLGHAQPVDSQPFKSTLKVPIRFDADHYGLVYPNSTLSRPVRGADPRKRIELNTRLEQYWAIRPPDIISKLRRVLAVSVLGGDPSLQALASALNMHPRTLNRRLRERGTTFQRELGLARFSLASQYLESSSVPLTTISNALGYADPSVFTRSFERWSGTTPSQWRLTRANHDHLVL